MKRKKIASIDVGTSKICTVMADTDGEDLRILGVGITPSNGLQKGLVVNLNDAKESIRQSIKAAEQAVGYKLESAMVSITGRHISSVNNRGVIAITSNKQMVRQDDVERVLKVAQNVAQTSASGSMILHLIPQTYAVDGQKALKILSACTVSVWMWTHTSLLLQQHHGESYQMRARGRDRNRTTGIRPSGQRRSGTQCRRTAKRHNNGRHRRRHHRGYSI
jgi:hypothetical protein